MRPDPVVLTAVGEEEKLLVAVVERGQAGGDPDQDLLDAAELPGSEARIDADRSGHRRPR